MSPRRVVSVFGRMVVAVAVPTACATFTVTCFAPTEVRIVVSTELSCASGPRTSIDVGDSPTGTSSVAETNVCTPESSGEATIGSLTVVPSGSRTARVGVRVTLALPPKSPAECTLARPEGCIVATRSVSFIEHSSLTLPVRLYKNCLGVLCANPDETCKKGKCVSNTTPNLDTPEPLDASPGDDASDAPIDAPLAPGPCTSADGGDILAEIGSPLTLAATDTQLVWTEGQLGGARNLRFLPRHPAAGESPTTAPASGVTYGHAVNRTVSFRAYDDVSDAAVVHAIERRTLDPSFSPLPAWPTTAERAVSFAFTSDGTLYALGSAGSILSTSNADSPGATTPVLFQSAGGKGALIAASTSNVYVMNVVTRLTYGRQLIAFPRGSDLGTPAIPISDFAVRIASNQQVAFAALGTADALAALTTPNIVNLANGVTPVATAGGPVSEMAVADTEVFWMETVGVGPEKQIMKAPHVATLVAGGLPAPSPVVTGLPDGRGLVVDPNPDGCIYYWAPSPAAPGGALRIAPKTRP